MSSIVLLTMTVDSDIDTVEKIVSLVDKNFRG